MKIIITGARGQLGQDITKFCERHNFEYIAADSKTLDITNAIEVTEFCNREVPDVIINCAAYNEVDRAQTDWKFAYLVNGIGVKNLVFASNLINATLVHYSTDYVFDGQLNRPYTIADRPRPLNRYGESKLLGEDMVRNLCDSYFLIRTSWVFGSGNVNFPKKVLEWSKSKKELKIVTDQVSSPTYTIDLAKATFDLLKSNYFGLYHITNSGYCSRYEWANYLLNEAGWKGTLLPSSSDEFSSPALRPTYSVLDNFGTEETIGYSLPSWKDATQRFLGEIGVNP